MARRTAKTMPRERSQRARGPKGAPGVRVPKLTTTPDRVRYIADRMSDGDWTGGATPACAVAWQLSESRVRKLAAEARRYKEYREHRESEAADLHQKAIDAMNRIDPESGLPDYAGCLAAVRTGARLYGIMVDG